MRVATFTLVVCVAGFLGAFFVACVDGTTPDCSKASSGCFDSGIPEDTTPGDTSSPDTSTNDGGQSDATDASSLQDVSPTTD